MGYTDDYLIWLAEKYWDGDEFPEDEDLEGFLEDMGEDVNPFQREWEFARDDLLETIEIYEGEPPKWDVFLSYAGPQQPRLVAPIARALREEDLQLWYDQVEYPRDGPFNGILYRVIHEGIARSQVGVVFLSGDFVKREWPMHEYRGLRSRGLSRMFLVVQRSGQRALRILEPDLDWNIERNCIASTADHSTEEIAARIHRLVEQVQVGTQ